MGIEEIKASAADIAAMADAAATTFYDCSVKYGTGKYPRMGIRKAKSWSTFARIARSCLAKGIPVEAFVTAAFQKELGRHAVIAASDIAKYDPKKVTLDSSITEGVTGTVAPAELWNLLSCKLLDMVFAIDGVKNKLDLLDSPMYGFPAWFRVFSPERPVGDIIVHWGDLAFDELKENIALDEYLKKKRPESYRLLKEVVKRLTKKSKESKEAK